MILPTYRYRGPFNPQKNINKWSCVPTAFAICLNIPVEDIIEEIGHDGSNIISDYLPEPLCRRGFHLQELFKVCLKHGYAVTPFDVEPELINADYSKFKINEDITYLLENNIGVLCGHFKDETKPHCVAWDGNYIVDPNEIFYPLNNFSIGIFYLLNRVFTNDSISEKDKKLNQEKIFTSYIIFTSTY